MLKCRKCGGGHLTIKCGKSENENNNISQSSNQNTSQSSSSNHNKNLNTNYHNNNNNNNNGQSLNHNKNSNTNYHNNNSNNNGQSSNHNYIRKKKEATVKINNLPDDMTDQEMQELTYEWGNILNIKVLNYNENSVAYIDFAFLKEAEHFVKALDKTSFEYMILDLKLV